MAIKKIQIKPPDNNYADILHPETSADVVLIEDEYSDFESDDVEGALNELRNKVWVADNIKTLLQVDWVTNTDSIYSYKLAFYYDLTVMVAGIDGVALIPMVTIDKESQDVAQAAGMSPTCEILSDGKIYFYAKSIPTADINFTCVFFRE